MTKKKDYQAKIDGNYKEEHQTQNILNQQIAIKIKEKKKGLPKRFNLGNFRVCLGLRMYLDDIVVYSAT